MRAQYLEATQEAYRLRRRLWVAWWNLRSKLLRAWDARRLWERITVLTVCNLSRYATQMRSHGEWSYQMEQCAITAVHASENFIKNKWLPRQSFKYGFHDCGHSASVVRVLCTRFVILYISNHFQSEADRSICRTYCAPVKIAQSSTWGRRRRRTWRMRMLFWSALTWTLGNSQYCRFYCI